MSLIFRALAPMRSRDNLRAVVEGIEQMGREEARTGSGWLSIARATVGFAQLCGFFSLRRDLGKQAHASETMSITCDTIFRVFAPLTLKVEGIMVSLFITPVASAAGRGVGSHGLAPAFFAGSEVSQ